MNKEKLKQVIVECINQQLLPYDLTYDDVKKGGKKEFIKVFKPKLNTLWGFIKYPTFYEKIPWYQYYTFKTKEQFEDWKTFCILKMIKCGYTKAQAEFEFSWLKWVNFYIKFNELFDGFEIRQRRSDSDVQGESV